MFEKINPVYVMLFILTCFIVAAIAERCGFVRGFEEGQRHATYNIIRLANEQLNSETNNVSNPEEDVQNSIDKEIKEIKETKETKETK